MKINRVELKNYRTHSELEVEFTEGINLLLGSNGSGKTSVLEAIGIAMFDTGNRSTVKETIKTGEKSATINIDFTGNDGIEYIVERKIGSVTRHRIYEKNNPEKELSGKSEVIDKVTELCGIKKNSSKIYESVVTVRQNEIVNLFMGTNSEREAVFNEIFDTEIYREIYKSYSKEALDKYKQDIEITNAKINEIIGMLVDVDELKAELAENVALKNSKEEIKTAIDGEIKSLEKEKIKLDGFRELINSSSAKLESNNEFMKSLKTQLEKNKVNFIKAEEAKEIVIEKRDNYLDYKESMKKLRVLQDEIRELEKLKTQKDMLKTDSVNIEKKILSMQSEVEKNFEQIKFTNNNLLELGEEKDKKTIRFQELKSNEIEIKEELNRVTEVLELLEIELEKINELEKEHLVKKAEESKLKDFIEKFDYDNHNYAHEELNKNKEKNLENKNKREVLEKKQHELSLLLDQNKEASDILGEGICPYLNEKCKNISEDNDINIYFSNKSNDLLKNLDEVKEQLSHYTDIESIEKKLNIEQNKLDYEKSNLKKKKEEFKYLQKELEAMSLRDSNMRLELRSKLSADVVNIHSELVENYRFNELKEKLVSVKVSLETKVNSLNIEEQERELQKLNMTIKLKREEIKKIESGIEHEKINIRNFELEIRNIHTKLEEYEERLKSYTAKKENERSLLEKIENLQDDYEQYRAYIEIAKTYHDLKAEGEELESSISARATEMKELEAKITEYKQNYNEEDFLAVKEKLAEIKMEVDSVQKELFDIEYKIKDITKELQRYKENKEKIKSFENENSKLKKKIDLTEKFRVYINKIGKNISKQMIEKISLISTENFREITGRSEMLEWRTTDKEAYMLYLVNDKDSRKFTLLSGGEQVAVALAVRAAMASALSKANFAIFDEPTNNLDEERRKALADSLSKILEGIKQSIIVTHDDTFQEMASKIIRLG